ncbi:Centrosomal Protein Of 85 Kda-Like [Manis pentadactyla]|nr:Centrosomal Protein Of 85 Kda-Like [Manis pentadactyla]
MLLERIDKLLREEKKETEREMLFSFEETRRGREMLAPVNEKERETVREGSESPLRVRGERGIYAPRERQEMLEFLERRICSERKGRRERDVDPLMKARDTKRERYAKPFERKKEIDRERC